MRPACERCISGHNVCNYDMEEGMTRQEYLRSQLSDQANEMAQLETILYAMRHGTDEEATEVLARLRLGESVAQLCSMLRSRTEAL